MKIFDMHGDILFDIFTRYNTDKESKVIEKYHYERLKKGDIYGGIFVIWLPEKNYLNEEMNIETSREYFFKMLDAVEKDEENTKKYCEIIKNKDDLNNIFQLEKIYFLKGIEGLRVIDSELKLLDTLYKKGYRHCSLTWNEENILGTGARGDKDRGLTELGKKAILKMNNLGMIVDLSHLNEKSFWDAIEISEKPVIASHSSSRKLCDHVRNLTDEQIEAVSKKGGVIGVNAYSYFIDSDEKKRDVERYVDHVEHVISIGGIDCAGLGFDFCEFLPFHSKDENLVGLKDASEAQSVINILRERGYSVEEIEKIAYKNILRVLEEVI